jgi:hypothetical protein
LRNQIKKALWPLLPKPWETQDMEFHWGLWNGVSALYSEGGRQLGEENTRPFLLNHHLDAQTIACKYEGSRRGRLINMSALRTAMQNFDAALAVTEAVRAYHIAQGLKSPPSDADALGIWDLYVIARCSIALVAFQQREQHGDRSQLAGKKTVSDVLTSQYQFISGVFMICRHMMEHDDPAIASNQIVSAEALYQYADDHGIFISFNGMACAGSFAKIMEFLRFCHSGGGQSADLLEIVSAPDKWYQYALATVELDCLIEQERLRARGEAGGIYLGLGAYVRSLMAEPPETSHRAPKNGGFEAAALARQNRILALLGCPAMTRLPAKHVAQRLA